MNGGRAEGAEDVARRIAVVASGRLVEEPAERGIEDAARIAAAVCGTPIALVTVIDGTRQWFKARVGIDLEGTDIADCVCLRTLDGDAAVAIPDLGADAGTRDMWFVRDEPALRFYAGARLTAPDGTPFGSVCVLDSRSRPGGLTADQAECLEALARQVSSIFAMREMIAGNGRAAGEAAATARRVDATLAFGDMVHGCLDEGLVKKGAVEAIAGALGCRRVGYCEVDAAGSVGRVDAEWTAPGEASLRGSYRLADGWDPLMTGVADGEPVRVNDLATHPLTIAKAAFWEGLGIGSACFCATLSHGRLAGLLFVHGPEADSCDDASLAFLRDVAARLCDAIARIEATRRERLNAGEMGHRLKNVLAMVLAIADQTLRAEPDRAAARTALRGRIVALSEAQDLLVDDRVEGAPLEAVVRGAMHAFAFGDVGIGGCDVTVGPRTATSFAMVLHELATNAAKHGSLCRDGGRVAIAWTLTGGEGAAALDFTWRESGGPEVAAPRHEGFGSRVIRAGFAPGVKVEQAFERSGVTCRVSAPCEALRA